MKEKHFIGEPILITVGDDKMTIGELIRFVKTETGTKYTVREPSLEPTDDGWNYHTVTEDQILNVQAKKTVSSHHNEWVVSHMAEINKAFGTDVSRATLIILYDSLEQAVDGFGEYALDKKICQHVLDKWVFIAC